MKKKKNTERHTVDTEAHERSWSQRWAVLFILGLIFIEMGLRNKISISFIRISLYSIY